MCDVESSPSRQSCRFEPPPGLSPRSDQFQQGVAATTERDCPLPPHRQKANADIFFRELTQSFEHDSFGTQLHNLLNMIDTIDQDFSQSNDVSSESEQESEGHELSLADIFHDSIVAVQDSMGKKFEDWFDIADVAQQMSAATPKTHGCFWHEWSLEEQKEACYAFAEAFQSIGALSVEGNLVRFVKQPSFQEALSSLPARGAHSTL